jgi:enediyne biosynthesis protein E4
VKRGVAVGLAWLCAAACGGPSTDAPAASPVADAAPAPWFSERATAVGLDFVHTNGASGRLLYPEILPPGVALVDLDNDGDLDVVIPQGRALTGVVAGSPALADGAAGGPRVFRNDLAIAADGSRTLRFTDRTAGSGLAMPEYALGVASGDVDDDGFVDLYVTGFDGSRLFRNRGDGTFADVTASSGVGNAGRLAVSAAFVDVDRDGRLDLYVANNVVYRTDNRTVCPNPAGAPDYCPPQIYGGSPDRFYRNLGGGRFRDDTARALPGLTARPGLGVSAADFDGDGWVDIFVANDGEPNFLWINQRDGTLREAGLPAGVALTGEGRAEASMGVDAGDYDNDGDEDLIITELTGQGTNVFANDGAGRFRDVGAASGIGGPSLSATGWGTAWVDVDNDGWLDTLAVNGTIIAQEGRAGRAFPYDQPKLLLRNLTNGRFEAMPARGGPAIAASESGRGAAFGDVDNDGDIDVVVGNDHGPLHLLVNDIGASSHWLGLRLVGRSGRDMVGARIVVSRPGRPDLWRRSRADGSYGSANDPRVLVGLGDDRTPPAVRVRWPDGSEESWASMPIDTWTTIRQGSGR